MQGDYKYTDSIVRYTLNTMISKCDGKCQMGEYSDATTITPTSSKDCQTECAEYNGSSILNTCTMCKSGYIFTTVENTNIRCGIAFL